MRTDDDPGDRPRGPIQEEGSPSGPSNAGTRPQRVPQCAQGRKLRAAAIRSQRDQAAAWSAGPAEGCACTQKSGSSRGPQGGCIAPGKGARPQGGARRWTGTWLPSASDGGPPSSTARRPACAAGRGRRHRALHPGGGAAHLRRCSCHWPPTISPP